MDSGWTKRTQVSSLLKNTLNNESPGESSDKKSWTDFGASVGFQPLFNPQSTQTDFERNNGVQVNIDKFRENYELKIATGLWHLEHGYVGNFTSWREMQNRTMQIQTMSLEANKRYYKTLDMIGAIGNVIADPLGAFITIDASPVESVASSEEERER